jgi:hypothetical protein
LNISLAASLAQAISIRLLLNAVFCLIWLLLPSRADALSQEENPLKKVTQLLPLKGGGIIAVTSQKGGLYMSGEEDGFKGDARAPESFIHRAALDNSGGVFIATPEGIYRHDGLDWVNVAQINAGLLAFTQDGGEALVKVWGKGLFRVHLKDLSRDRIAEEKELSKKISAMERQASALHKELVSAYTKHMTPEQTEAYLKKFSLWQQLTDEIEKLKGRRGPFREAQAGLGGAIVQSICALPDGGWLAGSFGQGVYHLRPSDSAWKRIPDYRGIKSVLCLGASPWGEWYVGTYGSGVLCLSGDNLNAGGLEGVIVQDIAFGAGEDVVAGTRGNGFIFSTRRGRSWNKALAGANIQAVAVDSRGFYWAAGWEDGVYFSKDKGATWIKVEIRDGH